MKVMTNNIQEWVKRVEEARPATIAMVMALQQDAVEVGLNLNLHRPVAAIPFVATFCFEDGVKTTIWFQMVEPPVNSDVVITYMGTDPVWAQRRGFGSRAVRELLAWAREHGLREIRATQAALKDTQLFWEKNGFAPCPEPNTTSDYVLRPK